MFAINFPELVPDTLCTTNIHVVIEGNMDKDGEPIVLLDKRLLCNFQDKGFRKLNAQQQLITLSGKVYFNGDIAPLLPVITHGYVEVFGVRRNIYIGQKARNPDGTVNFTELELE